MLDRGLGETALIEHLRERIARWHDDLLRPGSGRFVRLMSPAVNLLDGMIVVVAQSYPALDGSPTSVLCRVDRIDGRLVPICGRPGDQLDPRCAPSGNRLVFRSTAPSGFGACILDLLSGEAVSLPNAIGTVEQANWMPDGERIMLLVADPGTSLASVQGATASVASRHGLPNWYPAVEDGRNLPRRRIMLADASASRLDEIAPAINVWEICAAGNDRIAAVASDDPSEDAWYRADVRLIDVATGADHCLYRPRRQVAHLSSNAAGTHVAFVDGLASDRGHLAGDLIVVDVANDKVIPIDTVGVDVGWTGWRGDALLVAGIRRNDMVLLTVDLATKAASPFCELPALNGGTRYPLPAIMPGPELAVAVVLHGTQSMDCLAVITGENVETLVSLDSAESRRAVDHYGPDRQRAITWQASDGVLIDGWLHTPDGKGPFPLVMLIHGGPTMRWTPRSLLDSALQAALADRGIAQFMPNPRGSTGQGQAFAQAILHDMGGRDALDLLEGIDWLVATGVADTDRLAVTGISHGGFMSAWLVTQDRRFKAAAPVSPITDWTSQRLTSDIPTFNEDFIGSPIGGLPSPILHADAVTADVLLIAGNRDRCTPPAQAEEFHRALQLAGKRSTLVIYPEEGHGIRSNMAATIDHVVRIVAFIEARLIATIS